MRELQDKRNEERKKRLDTAANNYIVAVIEETNDEFDLGQFGFEFSLDEIEVRAMEIDPQLFDVAERKGRGLAPRVRERNPLLFAGRA